MAPVSSLHSSHYSLPLPPPPPPPPHIMIISPGARGHKKGFRQCKTLLQLQLLCSTKNEQHQNLCNSIGVQDESGGTTRTGRRDLLFQFQTAFTAFSFPAIFSVALADTDVADNYRVYSDDVNKFKIMVPQDWQTGAGDSNGYKSVTAFFPEEPSTSNVSVVITGLGADFTRLESFGKVDAFAESLVNGLDRSWQRPPGMAAKLIDCKAANGLYYIEYTLQNPGESRRHLFSVLGMANNGWYNRLYTVTGQFVEEDSEKYGSKIAKAVASFRFI